MEKIEMIEMMGTIEETEKDANVLVKGSLVNLLTDVVGLKKQKKTVEAQLDVATTELKRRSIDFFEAVGFNKTLRLSNIVGDKVTLFFTRKYRDINFLESASFITILSNLVGEKNTDSYAKIINDYQLNEAATSNDKIMQEVLAFSEKLNKKYGVNLINNTPKIEIQEKALDLAAGHESAKQIVKLIGATQCLK